MSHHHWLLVSHLLHSHTAHAAHRILLLAHHRLLHSHSHRWWPHLSAHHHTTVTWHFGSNHLCPRTVHCDIVLSSFDILALDHLLHILVEVLKLIQVEIIIFTKHGEDVFKCCFQFEITHFSLFLMSIEVCYLRKFLRWGI